MDSSAPSLDRVTIFHVIEDPTGKIFVEVTIYFTDGSSITKRQPLERKPMTISLKEES